MKNCFLYFFHQKVLLTKNRGARNAQSNTPMVQSELLGLFGESDLNGEAETMSSVVYQQGMRIIMVI